MSPALIRIRNTILHILILLILLVVSILFFEQQINKTTPDVASAMEESSFPLVYMERRGVAFNCLSGYVQEMNVTRMRECITPLTPERQIGIEIQTFRSAVDSVSYEVISKDGRETLENTQVIKLTQDDDRIRATLTLQNKMLMNVPYVLKIRLSCGGRYLYYYTDVLLSDGLHTDEYLSYVLGFYDKTVNRTDLDAVGAAVEPDDTTDEDATLAAMDIHDSVDQLTWKALQPQIFYKPTPRIKEINTKTASLVMEYRIAASSDSGVTEIYNVDEFYRVRFTDSRVFLLNFERTTDEVFNPENNVLSSKGIRLGITGKDVQFKTDEKNRVIAFVQENELWTYQRADAKLTSVFGFPQKENMDYRDFRDTTRIRILRVTSDGDVWFVVAGYMNRGTHEGENGILLGFYDTTTAMVDEMVFLSSTDDRENLWRDIDTLAYVTDDASLFYVYLEEQLWKIRLTDRTFETAAENVRELCCAGSASGRYFSWLEEGEAYNSATLCYTDLENGLIERTEAAEGERLRPICYMDEDLVYGVARETDLARSGPDTEYFPMYRLVIMDGEGNTVKEYEPSPALVTKVTVSDHMLSLTRVTWSETGQEFTEALPDEIVSTDTSSSVAVGIATDYSAKKQTQIYLRVGGEITTTTPNIVQSKIIRYAAPRQITIPEKTAYEGLYFVYAFGGLQRICAREAQAVRLADEMVGVVTNDLKYCIWARGDRETTADMDPAKIPDAVKAGVTDPAALAEETSKTVLDLTGCTLDQILFYVSHGCPTAAMTDQGPVTIVGYDEFNTHLLDPGANEWRYYGINDSAELFENSGNVFYVYMEDSHL